MNIVIYGSDKPTIYVICSIDKSENCYKFLYKSLDTKGINENNCRFAFMNNDNNPILSSDYNKINDDICNDINDHNPELVITIGENISSIFINKFSCMSICHGIVYKRKFGLNEFKIMPLHHPGYVMRHSTIELKTQFKEDIQKIILICSGEMPDQIISSDPIIKKEDFKDETYICLNYKEFDNFCREEIDNESLIAYDIETNAKEKTSINHKVVGFSLASNSKRGCYVVLRSIDYTMPDKDIKVVEARLRKILLNKRILVYNYMHEELATLNWLGIEMTNVEDLFVMVKLLMGNADKYEGNGGLKIQCEMNLNTKDWSEDLDLYMQYFRSFNKNNEPMINLLNKYYSYSEVEELLPLISEQCNNDEVYENGGKVISYGVVPYKLIGKYGGIDSSILFDLLNFYKDRINKLNSELGIDLMIGYKYWMNHHFAGYTLERNGAYFNEDKASEVENWCKEGMIESLKNMIKSDLSESYIKDNIYTQFLIYLKDNYLSLILNGFAIPKRMYKSSVHVQIDDRIVNNPLKTMFSRMSMIPNKKGIYKLELGNIETLAKKYLTNIQEIYDEWYNNYINEFNSKEHTIEEMKNLINPTATGEPWKKFLTSILITDDIKYAKLYTLMIGVIESPDFDINRYYGEDDKKLMELMIKLKSSDIKDTKKFDIFCKFFTSNRNIKSKFLNRKISESLNYSIDSMNEEYILELYNLYVLCGLDIEDRNTWSDSFDFLYNFRKYKKYSKIISTYINGRVGRNNVWYVDRNSFENGDTLTVREIPYWEKDKYDLSNKIPMYQSSFFVDMADTGRWKSGFHTLPAGDTVKQIYSSRFKGGIIAMPDCSQAEVRMLAAVSQDENLLNAFQKEGMDIHKYVASLCLEGSTRIKLLDGTNPTIEELYNSDRKEFYVYSADDNNNGRIVPGLAHDVRITKQVTELVEIELDSGDIIRCTGNHPFRTRDRGYVNAEDLEINESISPLYTKFDRGYEMFYDLDSEKFEYTHKRVCDEIYPGISFSSMVRHHKDTNKQNNDPSNLQLLTWEEHVNVHKLNNPLLRYIKSEENSIRMRERMNNLNQDPEFVKKRNKAIAETGKKFLSKDGEFRNNPKYESSVQRSLKAGYENIKNLSHETRVNNAIKANKKNKNNPVWIDKNKKHMQEITSNISERQICRNVLSKSCGKLDKWKPFNYKKNTRAGWDGILNTIRTRSKQLSEIDNVPQSIILIEFFKDHIEFLKNNGFDIIVNHKVKAIRHIELNNPINVYDLTVDKYHNFCISCSNNSGVFVHNCFHNGDIEAVTKTERKIAKGAVFGILYGESVESFAESFTQGDLNEAEKIFDYFYTAFPKIKEYVEDAHNQVLTTNKVALRMMNRFINLEQIMIENGGDKNKVLRQGQNFIIQGQTCDLAGMILYNICKFIEDNNLKSKPFCFIHDSIEIDIHPDETFLMLDKLKPLFNSYPWETFGVPMSSDIVFSSNMGAEIDTVELIHDDEYNDVTITMKGFEDDIDEVIKLWNDVYDVCELIESEDEGELYVPIAGLFQKKVTMSKLMGTTRKEVKRKYHIIRKCKDNITIDTQNNYIEFEEILSDDNLPF